MNFRIIASPVQPLQHAALDQSGEKVANAFLGSKLACRQDEFMSLLGQEGAAQTKGGKCMTGLGVLEVKNTQFPPFHNTTTRTPN